MGQLRTGVASLLLASVAGPALAQQGSVQVSASGQAVTGDETRLGTQPRWEPDFGITWLQPRSSFGSLQIEVRGTRRGELLHPGRAYVALRDFKRNGITWTFEGGDAYFTPAVSDYKFNNLLAPQVTFTGGAVSARTPRSTLALVAGWTSAWRNVFGTDPDTLDQSIALARASHTVTGSIELNARASRIRTTNLKEFSFTISASDQASAGIKLTVTPALHLSADAGLVSFRRAGRTDTERDVSAMVGASWLHSRGWLQLNASRFSPGEFPVLNYQLQDRETLFAATDYDLFPRVRVFGGGEAFRSNLDPLSSAASSRPTPRGEGLRGFGGFRVRLAQRMTLTLRSEQGDRRSKPTGLGRETESDTGMWGAEWQIAFGRVNAAARYARRENVDRSPALFTAANGNGSYTQDDSAAQFFFNVSRSAQVFATTALVRQSTADSANTYVQLGGGGQVQWPNRDLWMRAEATAARNVDLFTNSYVPRESLTVGLNGRLTRLTSVGVNVNVDHAPTPLGDRNPWMTRSTFRLVRTIPTGAAAVASGGTSAMTPSRGTGSIVGVVFADWNANGVNDPGENTLEGIPVRIIPAGTTVTGRDGQFTFTNVPVGLRQVGLDTSALPVDFDPPATGDAEIELSRGDTRRVAFGLIPLGAIFGRVLRDVNGNGTVDPGDEPLDDAVIIMDDAARSEQVRKGRYRFDAVRGGDHNVKLLLESLPPGAVIKGPAEVQVTLARDRMIAEVPFLVAVEKRPEIRRVFPPKGGGTPPSAPARTTNPPGDTRTEHAGFKATEASAPAAAPRAAAASPRFAIQIAALVNGDRAAEMVQQLKAAKVAAYLLKPKKDDPFYRVRVGPFLTRAAAERTLAALEALRQEKLWVTRVAAR